MNLGAPIQLGARTLASFAPWETSPCLEGWCLSMDLQLDLELDDTWTLLVCVSVMWAILHANRWGTKARDLRFFGGLNLWCYVWRTYLEVILRLLFIIFFAALVLTSSCSVSISSLLTTQWCARLTVWILIDINETITCKTEFYSFL